MARCMSCERTFDSGRCPLCILDRAEKAEAFLSRLVAIVGRFRVKDSDVLTVQTDCDVNRDLIELYLDVRKDRGSTSVTPPKPSEPT